MGAPVDMDGDMERLRRREQELLDQIRQLTQLNNELAEAAETSRNFKASVDAGYVLDLDSWETS